MGKSANGLISKVLFLSLPTALAAWYPIHHNRSVDAHFAKLTNGGFIVSCTFAS